MEKALLLDRNYMALSLVSWKKAVKLLVKGKAEAVAGSGSIMGVKSVSGKFSVPSIVRLLVTTPWRAHSGRMKFSRKNVHIRDKNLCQYCGIKVGKNATIDHVIPKSKGGKTDYFNCVTSCKACNGEKADRTPEEVGMQLLNAPKRPTFMTLYRRFLDNSPQAWRDYIIGA
jgi:5-methylcytosine-specific restriction endonuclease McrA